VQQSIDISWPPGPQQQTRRSGVRRPNDEADRETDGHPTITQTLLPKLREQCE